MRTNVLKFLLTILLASFFTSAKAETVALSDDPNFIKASILIFSPGESAQSFSGHAALRLQCPPYNLDKVFTFENNGNDNFINLVIKGAQGRIFEIEFNKYYNDFKSSGRGIKEYPLNLTLNEKARLWEVCDSLKDLPDQRFDKDFHCFSSLAEALDLAVAPNHIGWTQSDFYWNSYGDNAKIFTRPKAPWHYILLMLPLGELADSQGERTGHIYPIIFDTAYASYYINGKDGSRRPLVDGSPRVLIPITNNSKGPTHPTPLETALSVLLIVALITVMQLLEKWKIVGCILDVVLWISVTVGGIFVAILTWAPGHFGASWNWVLLVLNPLAWIPMLIFRKNREVIRWIWIFYALVLVLFAAYIWVIAPSTDVFWRLLALALAVRCAFHASATRRP